MIFDLKLVINDGTGVNYNISGTKFSTAVDGITYTFVSSIRQNNSTS